MTEYYSDPVPANTVYVHIHEKYGPLLNLEDISEILKYKSSGSIRRAYYRKTLPIKLFRIPGRSGLFCTAVEISDYIQRLEFSSEQTQP